MGFKIVKTSKPKSKTRKKPKPKRNKMETSKLIFIGVSILTTSVTIFSMVMMWRTGDLSPLAYLIPSTFLELATATGFYYNKAKAENLNKSYTSQDNYQAEYSSQENKNEQ